MGSAGPSVGQNDFPLPVDLQKRQGQIDRFAAVLGFFGIAGEEDVLDLIQRPGQAIFGPLEPMTGLRARRANRPERRSFGMSGSVGLLWVPARIRKAM